MSKFINTIDLLGDDTVIDSIIDRTITEFRDDQITSVGERGFSNCANLVVVDTPNIQTTGLEAFMNCVLLEEFVNNKIRGNTHLGHRTFQGCTSLKRVRFPELVGMHYTSIFNKCTSLLQADFPSLASIAGTNLFRDNTSLKALILRNSQLCTLKNTGNFTNTPIESGTGWIYVPGDLVNTYASATNWATYKNQFRGIIDDEDALNGIIDETLTDFQNDEIESVPAFSFYNYAPLKSVKSDSVTEIGEGAFKGATDLASVEFENVTTIGKEAFQNTALTELTAAQFPKVDTIGAGAFTSCPNIKTIDLPSATLATNLGIPKCTALTSVNLPNLETKNNAGYSLSFANCTNLVSANLPKLEKFSFYGGNEFANCTNLTNVNVQSLVRVGGLAFSRCTSLTKLDLPKITTIGNNAFEYTQSLIALILRNENLCTIGTDAFKGTSAIGSGTGYIYVPAALIEDYKVAENWSTYAAQFRALEDYTVDGTTTGELDESKI